jgi:glycosyltransferase involved in cell wall biosynthesis
MNNKALVFIEDGSFTFDNRVKREVWALINNGWDVTVVCPRNKGDKSFEKVNNQLRVLFFPKYNGNSVAGHLVEHLMSLIIGFIYVLFSYIRYGRFKIFHACNPTDFLWLIYQPFKFLGVKFIFDQHDLCPELYLSRPGTSSSSRLYKSLLWHEKRSYKIAKSVISTNESYKKVAITRGKVEEKNVFVVRNGPLLSRFDLTKILPDKKKSEEILVGYLGNMNLPDGVDEILYFAQEIVLIRGIENIKFVLIGGGANQQNLVNLSKKLGLQDHLTFTGRVSDKIMLSKLRSCDLCIQPDPFNPLNNISTMNKIMEYMALEKPFVSYDLIETRVSGGECGLYAAINNKNDFIEKILKLANDAELRTELGLKGRKRIENDLEWSHSVPNLLAAYCNANS